MTRRILRVDPVWAVLQRDVVDGFDQLWGQTIVKMGRLKCTESFVSTGPGCIQLQVVFEEKQQSK
ncbi:hypothetical protein DPMN_068133 [Dreissena polymorpha]|uniref:Uncharacterized protein n=1 Tax=Dreissena polymorpha TaxID=45954 RepID=A0A9D4BLX8_DREPO|nr:hypothetical protein DPMN_068133 [Dreissena polymorpha]